MVKLQIHIVLMMLTKAMQLINENVSSKIIEYDFYELVKRICNDKIAITI